MGVLTKAMQTLQQYRGDRFRQADMSFAEFLGEVIARPERNIRNVIQVYADMVRHFVRDGHDEYRNDPESINYLNYDCSRLFVEGSDRPFFADCTSPAGTAAGITAAWRSNGHAPHADIFDDAGDRPDHGRRQ